MYRRDVNRNDLHLARDRGFIWSQVQSAHDYEVQGNWKTRGVQYWDIRIKL